MFGCYPLQAEKGVLISNSSSVSMSTEVMSAEELDPLSNQASSLAVMDDTHHRITLKTEPELAILDQHGILARDSETDDWNQVESVGGTFLISITFGYLLHFSLFSCLEFLLFFIAWAIKSNSFSETYGMDSNVFHCMMYCKQDLKNGKIQN